MSTIIETDEETRDLVFKHKGLVVMVKNKPYAFFRGSDAVKNGELLAIEFRRKYGYNPKFAGEAWREDQRKVFDYAVRLDP